MMTSSTGEPPTAVHSSSSSSSPLPPTGTVPPLPSSAAASSFSASLANGIPEFVPRAQAVATPSEHVATPETEERGADVEVGFAAGAGTGTFHTLPGAAAVAPSQTADLGLEETFGATIPPSLDPHPHSHLQPMTSVTPGLGQPQSMPVDLDPRSASSALSGGGGMPSYYNQLNSVGIDVGSRHQDAGVMTLLFDHSEQLIWQGNSVGHVTSYYGPQLRKYSSFQVHQSQPIRQLETVENALISLAQNSLRLSQRGGLTLYDFPPFYDCDLQCMLLLDQASLLLGGHQNSTLMLDLHTAQVVSRIPSLQDDVVIMRGSESSVCLGHSNGSISFMDPVSLTTIKCIQSHTGSLSDFSVSGNTLISCGFSDQLLMDNFVNVYDIRNCRLIFSHQFNVNPFYVRFFPMYNNRALVLSQFGHFQIVDPSGLAIPESLVLHKVALSNPDTVVTACDLSSTSRALVFGDSSGILQLYGDNPDPVFNEYANPTEFPAPPPSNMYIAYDDYSVPLSAVPFPFTPQALPFLSDLPKSVLTSRYYDVPKIPTEIESKIDYVDFIGYAPFPVGWVRNQVPYKPHEYLEHLPDSLSSRDGSPLDDEKSGLYPEGMPSIYEKVCAPCCFGDSFQDDSLKNLGLKASSMTHVSCKFPTMENNSINGYANMLVYALSTMEPLSAYIRSHLCKRELCLTCEVSCIIDTLKRAPSDYSFAPYNFLRVFSMLPETTALGLVISEFDDSPNASNSYSKLLQSFNRFLLQQIHQELQRDEELSAHTNPSSDTSSSTQQSQSAEKGNETSEKTTTAPGEETGGEGTLGGSLSEAVAKLLGVVTEQTSTCKCGNEVRRESCNFTTPLIYPDLFGLGAGARIFSFETVVKYSLTSETSTQAWCSKCHKYQPTVQKKKILRLPHLLSLNCQLDKQREVAFWKVQQKLSHDPKCHSDLTAPNTTVGMCRFGNNCTRKDCKFRHEKDSDIQASIERFVNSGDNDFDWVPRSFKMPNPANDKSDQNEDSKNSVPDFEYELAGSVLHVPAKGTRGHMVARVKLNDKYYVINDTAINEISEIEINKFNLNWAVPCILFYVNKNLPSSFTTLKLPTAVKREFLSDEMKLVELNKGLRKIFSPIAPDEEFDVGSYVGLDMNVISNCKQETDINPDGSYKTITSSENSIIVTRVVCFRGNSSKIEPLASLPLIDDHAQSKETVVEYINKLGGLDMSGGKHLATFKQTFLKLKYLVDRKVVIVGHNIERKLKMFNLFVPKDQLRDTASIYKLSRHESLSLKFMADYFGIPYHRSDVLRDCYASLQLYNNYLKITNDGRTMQAFRMSLQDMYNSAAAQKPMLDKTGSRTMKKP